MSIPFVPYTSNSCYDCLPLVYNKVYRTPTNEHSFCFICLAAATVAIQIAVSFLIELARVALFGCCSIHITRALSTNENIIYNERGEEKENVSNLI